MTNSISSSAIEDFLSGKAVTTKFKDRTGAGKILGMILEESTRKCNSREILVIAVPRGGVIVGSIVSNILACKLGVLIVGRIRAPNNRELSLGAITVDGTKYLNNYLIKKLKVPSNYIRDEIIYQKIELRHKKSLLCKGIRFPRIKNKAVILVDDGIASGATAIVAARWIRKHYPMRLIIASPVSPVNTLRLLKREVDQIEVLATPRTSNFLSVDQFYDDFKQVSDNEVIQILQRVR